MSMTAALRDRLIAATVAGGEIFRDLRPQGGVVPAIVLFLISDPRPTVHGGMQALRRSRVQMDCLADSRGAADALAEIAINVAAPAASLGGVIFSRTFVANVRGNSLREGDVTTFVTSVDLFVWHRLAG